jgi:uncharacterized protein YndB with AHSA1/START domain
MTAVRLQRTIAAKPAQVYRAWLDPGLLARWMSPDTPATGVSAEVDERVGGHFRIFHADGSGFDAELLELVPDRRIAYAWGFVGPQRRQGPVFDSVLTVTFDDTEDGTLLTLVHERLDALAAAMPEVAGQIENGWSLALDNLSTLTEVRL